MATKKTGAQTASQAEAFSATKIFPIIFHVDVYVPDAKGGRSKRVPTRIVISVNAKSPEDAAARFQAGLMQIIK